MIHYFLRLFAKAIGLVAVLAMPITASAAAYLSLGDSLAVGVQPIGDNNTEVLPEKGYANQLFSDSQFKAKYPFVDNLRKLGCPGETTGSMIYGSLSPHCSYDQGSQLKEAKYLLETDPSAGGLKGAVALITIDIGAVELADCQTGTSLDRNCIKNALINIQKNLPIILKTLRDAAGPDVPIIVSDPLTSACLVTTADK